MMKESKLIEPLGIIHGEQAREAISLGIALPFWGKECAFSCVRLIQEGEKNSSIFPVERIPVDWLPSVQRLLKPPPMVGLPSGCLIMGIVNITPDSFSDGGQYVLKENAVKHALTLKKLGADLIDLGGESTRPGARPVSVQEEIDRVLPVLEAIKSLDPGLILSVDTRHAKVMELALAAGANIINDVSALTHDPDSIAVIAKVQCPVILMHMRGQPHTMSDMSSYNDIAVDVMRELGACVANAEKAGINKKLIIIDPGIGFAKIGKQNFTLLRRITLLANLGCRVVIGLSRKRFLTAFSSRECASSRDLASVIATSSSYTLPHTIVRMHNVEAMQTARLVWQAGKGP